MIKLADEKILSPEEMVDLIDASKYKYGFYDITIAGAGPGNALIIPAISQFKMYSQAKLRSLQAILFDEENFRGSDINLSDNKKRTNSKHY